MIENTKNMLNFIDNSPTPYQVIKNVCEMLDKNEFSALEKNKKWQLEIGKNYYITNENSSLVAFSLADDIEKGFNIVAAHTDSPLIKIKPYPSIIYNEHYISFNIEVYGGAILSTWFDRGLSIAGRVIVKEAEGITTKIIDIKRTILTIPSVAIHLSKDKKESAINIQNEMKPILGFLDTTFSKNDYLLKILQDELFCEKEGILDFDLYLYDTQKGEIFGANNEFYQSKNLDDLLMVYTSLTAFLNSSSKKTKVLFLTDNEEIGSNSATGAYSVFFENVLERILLNFGKSKEDYFISLANSYCLSCDLAHAYHPNYSEKYDETNRALLGKGIVIKHSANKSYSTESYYSSLYKNELKKHNINFQDFANRSNIRGGSTIGPMLSAKFGFSAVDVGASILGMHSIRETGAVIDIDNTIDAIKCFYEMV